MPAVLLEVISFLGLWLAYVPNEGRDSDDGVPSTKCKEHILSSALGAHFPTNKASCQFGN